jgi:hypothetical protein
LRWPIEVTGPAKVKTNGVSSTVNASSYGRSKYWVPLAGDGLLAVPRELFQSILEGIVTLRLPAAASGSWVKNKWEIPIYTFSGVCDMEIRWQATPLP